MILFVRLAAHTIEQTDLRTVVLHALLNRLCAAYDDAVRTTEMTDLRTMVLHRLLNTHSIDLMCL